MSPLFAVRALTRSTLDTEYLGRFYSLHQCRHLASPLYVLILQHLHDIMRLQFRAAHLQTWQGNLVALGKAAQQSYRRVFIPPSWRRCAAELRAAVEEFIAIMNHIAAFLHHHTKELSLEVDAYILLRATVECLQAVPCNTSFLTVVNHMVVVRIHMQQHHMEGSVVMPRRNRS